MTLLIYVRAIFCYTTASFSIPGGIVFQFLQFKIFHNSHLWSVTTRGSHTARRKQQPHYYHLVIKITFTRYIKIIITHFIKIEQMWSTWHFQTYKLKQVVVNVIKVTLICLSINRSVRTVISIDNFNWSYIE